MMNHLNKPIKDLRFWQYFAFLTGFTDAIKEITTPTVSHNNIESLISDKWLFKCDNVGMPECLEYFELILNILFSLFIKISQTQFFGNIELIIE